MQLRIEASDLPGRTCGLGDNFPGYSNVHVGVQRRDRRNELLELHPGDAPSAVWTLDCSAVSTSTGVDLKGPYIQGRPGTWSPRRHYGAGRWTCPAGQWGLTSPLGST